MQSEIQSNATEVKDILMMTSTVLEPQLKFLSWHQFSFTETRSWKECLYHHHVDYTACNVWDSENTTAKSQFISHIFNNP